MAYEILFDKDKRKKYDQYGLEGLNDDPSMDGMDIFQQMFSGHQSRVRKAKDVVHNLDISLNDLYNGKIVKLAITRNVIKGECTECEECGGKGVKISMRQIGPGMRQQVQTHCNTCNGNCYKYELEKEKNIIEVVIEKGTSNGKQLRFNNMGNDIPKGETGDVVFVIKEKKHQIYKRSGNDLLVEKEICLEDALYGHSFDLETLDGKNYSCENTYGSCN